MPGEKQSIIDTIKDKVLVSFQDTPSNEKELWYWLARWWCLHYEKPFKNSEIWDYTVWELMEEFFSVYYHNNPDKIEEERSVETEKEDEEFMKRYLQKHSPEKKLLSKEESREEVERALEEVDTTGLSDEVHIDFDEDIF